MKSKKGLGLALLAGSLLMGCTTVQEVREIKLVSFDDDIKKGKSIGEVESNDCVYHIMGYWLGGAPTVRKSLANSRKQRKSSLTDVVAANYDSDAETVRYIKNVQFEHTGFNYYFFGKRCITTKGLGYT